MFRLGKILINLYTCIQHGNDSVIQHVPPIRETGNIHCGLLASFKTQDILRWLESVSVTLPETNSSHLKMDGWKVIILLGWKAYFQGRWLVLGRVEFLRVIFCHNANDHQRLQDMFFLTSYTTASYNIPVVSAHSKLSLICLFHLSKVIDIFLSRQGPWKLEPLVLSEATKWTEIARKYVETHMKIRWTTEK